jgi:outer membrane immunogenic protein
MKKLVLALTAVAAFTGSALAADLPARTYTKAPMMADPVYNWTGFYVFGGAGGGLWSADTVTVDPRTGLCVLCAHQQQGGSGYFGTVGAGYDWQFNSSWVAGVFADGQFGSLKGTIQDQGPFFVGNNEKLRDTWAVGVRLGYLVAPNVFSYVNAGYTGSDWSGTTMLLAQNVAATPFVTPSFSRNGWFVGGGVENNLNIFGISAPGWFMKTEYRMAYFDAINITDSVPGGGAFVPVVGAGIFNNPQNSIHFKPDVQTISTSLVYRFNWGGPLVAKY